MSSSTILTCSQLLRHSVLYPPHSERMLYLSDCSSELIVACIVTDKAGQTCGISVLQEMENNTITTALAAFSSI